MQQGFQGLRLCLPHLLTSASYQESSPLNSEGVCLACSHDILFMNVPFESHLIFTCRKIFFFFGCLLSGLRVKVFLGRHRHHGGLVLAPGHSWIPQSSGGSTGVIGRGDALGGSAGSLAWGGAPWPASPPGPRALLLAARWVYAGLRFPHCARPWKRAWAPRGISAGLCL